MSAAAPILLPPGDPPRKRFTRADVDRLEQAGVFDGLRFELIDGDLIDKMGQKPPHSSCLTKVLVLLNKSYRLDCIRVQSPMEAAAKDQVWNLPEPDLVVVPDGRDYEAEHPRGSDVILVVEVADTTLRHDLTTKRDLYARAGVREYWVLDVTGRRLIVHQGLNGEAYTRVDVLDESGRVGELAVSAMLPVAAGG
jgi:Uma2 family endonuclease